MQCCGPIQDISTMDDRSSVYLCGRCGKQGNASAFPDPMPEPEPKPLTRFEAARAALSEVLAQLADRISPKF